ncbi:hypothetical protein D3C79_757220 [compost metagenome]
MRAHIIWPTSKAAIRVSEIWSHDQGWFSAAPIASMRIGLFGRSWATSRCDRMIAVEASQCTSQSNRRRGEEIIRAFM